ncbi:unnamed protein product [Candidula unifasciata]|uniref:Uncharacterized protein n=1 Tax=Candidula unifasciata TaxID=100452 RepID=A0A8S3ZVU1_9EUPU|nr:unnamed protein product [Candidula unifasciata]
MGDSIPSQVWVIVNPARKRTCQLGLHNHHCALIDMERLKNPGNFLRSDGSPGKRSQEEDVGLPDNQMTSHELLAANALTKHDEKGHDVIVTDLQNMMRKVQTDRFRAEKRDCRFRLGGHCLTESLDRVASNYYYLKSPHSPGRRRRHLEVTSRRRHLEVTSR